MYGMLIYIWAIFGGNVGKYSSTMGQVHQSVHSDISKILKGLPGCDVRKFAFLILGGAIAFSGFYGFFLDPGAQP